MEGLPVNTVSGFIGLALLVFGLFLLLTGFQIIKIEKVSVAPGLRTWGIGIVFAIIGIILLMPETKNQTQVVNEEIPPTAVVEKENNTTSSSATTKDNIFLSELTPLSATVGYQEYSAGKYEFSSTDPSDNIREGDVIMAHGVEYSNGLYAHAPSNLSFDLSGNYSVMEATITMPEWIECGDGVVFINNGRW